MQAWDKQYRYAASFHRKLRRWPGPTEEYPAGNKLGAWCREQHALFAENRLPALRLRVLLSSGFPLRSAVSFWPPAKEEAIRARDRYLELFLFQFAHLQRFRSRYPDRWPSDSERFPADNPLGNWISRIRRDYGHRKLPAHHKNLLNSIGFDWGGARDANWNRQYETVKALMEKHQEDWRSHADMTLRNWVQTNRIERDAGRLPAARLRRIRALGGLFDRMERWEDSIEAIKAFLRAKHRWPHSTERDENGFHMGHWMAKQRIRLREGTLTREQIDLLRSLDFPFEAKVWKDQWLGHYEALQGFRQRYPDRWPMYEDEFPKGNALGIWCSVQKTKEARGVLKSERHQLLSKLGFPWALKHSGWEERYAEFSAWQRKHRGRLPSSVASDPAEARQHNWLIKQRTALRKGKVEPKRIRRLKEIGIRA